MSEMRRWHPWRRRIRGWVLRWLDRFVPMPPEPRWRRVASAREERCIQLRLHKRLRKRVREPIGNR